ncbi:hypothetical protein FRC15_012085 [Serendipita sp. 397]|nr:hypothetical protein FRC15_012085 [Serendipita sp. 397]
MAPTIEDSESPQISPEERGVAEVVPLLLEHPPTREEAGNGDDDGFIPIPRRRSISPTLLLSNNIRAVSPQLDTGTSFPRWFATTVEVETDEPAASDAVEIPEHDCLGRPSGREAKNGTKIPDVERPGRRSSNEAESGPKILDVHHLGRHASHKAGADVIRAVVDVPNSDGGVDSLVTRVERDASVAPLGRSESPTLPPLNIEHSFLANILEGVDPETRELIIKRAHVMRNLKVKTEDDSSSMVTTIVQADASQYRPALSTSVNRHVTFISDDSESDHARYTTAQKGKFRAIPSDEIPRQKRTGFWIEDDNDSHERMNAAFVESDRRFATGVQEREDAETARQLDAEFARDVLEGENRHQNDSTIGPVTTKVKTEDSPMVKSPKKSKSKSERPQMSSTLMSNIVREQSFVQPITRGRSTVGAPPASEQVSPGTYLGIRFGGPKRDRSESPSKGEAKRLRGGLATPEVEAGPRGGADSSNSEDSLDDTSSASSDASSRERLRKREKRKRYKKKKRQLLMASMVKLEAPPRWDGSPSVKVFEKWTYAITEYFNYNQLSRRARVITLPNFLSDKAAQWFMDHVSTDLTKWDFESIIRGMYDDLFPRNIKDILRNQFETAYQGSMKVRQWAQHIEKCRRRITDVSDKSLSRRFWDGANSYLKIKWTENGYTREFSNMEDLLEAAERYEAAEEQAKRERQKSSKQPSKQQETRQEPKQPKDESSTKPSNRESNRHTAASKPSSSKDKRRSKLSDKERDEHRAAGKCFECHQPGHLAKDCPSRTTARAPRVMLDAVDFPELEKKAKKKADITIGMMHLFAIEELPLYPSDEEAVYEVPPDELEIAVLAPSNRRKKTKEPEGGMDQLNELERNASVPKDIERRVPKGCVIEAKINGQAVRALVDTGSMGDFVSTTLVDQLKLPMDVLQKPLTLGMAVSGSRSNIQSSTTVEFECLDVKEPRRFDVVNLANYDVILGTPFLFQHKAIVGFNPTRFVCES